MRHLRAPIASEGGEQTAFIPTAREMHKIAHGQTAVRDFSNIGNHKLTNDSQIHRKENYCNKGTISPKQSNTKSGFV